jgi:hypothetical protein
MSDDPYICPQCRAENDAIDKIEAAMSAALSATDDPYHVAVAAFHIIVGSLCSIPDAAFRNELVATLPRDLATAMDHKSQLH